MNRAVCNDKSDDVSQYLRLESCIIGLRSALSEIAQIRSPSESFVHVRPTPKRPVKGKDCLPFRV